MKPALIIFGTSNIMSDLFDCALANQIPVGAVVLDLPEQTGERDLTLASRIAAMNAHGQKISILTMGDFNPQENEIYLLGPTTPSRARLADVLKQNFAMQFTRLIHPTAYVSPLAEIGEGVFVGANSVIGPGAKLGEHVFINRGVTIGHDTQIGAFTRVQPGSNLGGLSRIGSGVTVGIGATLIERLTVGDNAFIGAGAVVTADVEAEVLVVGIPAKIKKSLKP